MNKMTVIPSQTAAESTGVVVNCYEIQSDRLFVVADNLATTEEVDIEMWVGGDDFTAFLNNSAAAYKLTASQKMIEIPNPGYLIRIKKDATATATSVSVTWPSLNKRGG